MVYKLRTLTITLKAKNLLVKGLVKTFWPREWIKLTTDSFGKASLNFSESFHEIFNEDSSSLRKASEIILSESFREKPSKSLRKFS